MFNLLENSLKRCPNSKTKQKWTNLSRRFRKQPKSTKENLERVPSRGCITAAKLNLSFEAFVVSNVSLLFLATKTSHQTIQKMKENTSMKSSSFVSCSRSSSFSIPKAYETRKSTPNYASWTRRMFFSQLTRRRKKPCCRSLLGAKS